MHPLILWNKRAVTELKAELPQRTSSKKWHKTPHHQQNDTDRQDVRADSEKNQSCLGRTQLTGVTTLSTRFWGSLTLKEINLSHQELFWNTPSLDLQGVFSSNMQDCCHRAGDRSARWAYVMGRTNSIRRKWNCWAQSMAGCFSFSAVHQCLSHILTLCTKCSWLADRPWCASNAIKQKGAAELCCKCLRYASVRVDRQSPRLELMVKVSWLCA